MVFPINDDDARRRISQGPGCGQSAEASTSNYHCRNVLLRHVIERLLSWHLPVHENEVRATRGAAYPELPIALEASALRSPPTRHRRSSFAASDLPGSESLDQPTNSSWAQHTQHKASLHFTIPHYENIFLKPGGRASDPS